MLLKRLSERDTQKPWEKWVKFYKDIRKKKYEKVTREEADLILKYSQDNFDEIVNEIWKYLDKKVASKKQAYSIL